MGRLDTSADGVRSLIAYCASTDDAAAALGAIQRAITDYKVRGETVPKELLQVRETMTIECHAQSQGR
ncbi:MAG: hypothetical protein AAFR23_07185 [Pseudomonadota bacterium]